MSAWVRVFCRNSVAQTRPEDLTAGIGQRLRLLTFLYCPDKEEPPEAVLSRLTVTTLSTDSDFRVWALRWRPEPNPFIRVERWTGERAESEIGECRARLAGHPGADVAAVRAALDATVETVGFELKQSDLNTMGRPVAVAAAAWLAERADGLIHAESEGWLKPTPREVKRILPDN
jgi:hypothetical protein